MMRRAYRAAAAACAEFVARTALERRFVQIGRSAWSRPFIGRFYRSTAVRLADRFRKRGSQFRRVVVEGVPLVFDVSEFTASGLYFAGIPWEPQTTACLAHRLREGAVFVDVGANHGYFTVLAAALVGSTGQVVAFEPNPAVLDQLRTHVRLNNFDARVTTVPAALADAPQDAGTLFVSTEPGNSGLSSLVASPAYVRNGWLAHDRTVSVPVDTFDRWFESSALPRVDLVKIDVEGAEDRVLAGMAGSLAAGKVGAVICETPWEGPAHSTLCAAGFVPTRLEDFGDVCNILYVREPQAKS
jgi:FkbM family methyltransferase